MNNKFEIREFKNQEITEIINLFNRQLGQGYITEESFKKNEFCKVLVKSQKIIGACIYNVIDYSTMLEITKNYKIKELRKVKKIGFIKTIAIDKDFQKMGFGTKLLEEILLELNNGGVNKFLSTVWEYSNIANASTLLENFGFCKYMTIENYWYKSSLVEKFKCPYCGNPCHCNCVIYVKF